MKTSKSRKANVSGRKAVKNVSSARESTKTKIGIPSITIRDHNYGKFLTIGVRRNSTSDSFVLQVFPLEGDVPLTLSELGQYLREVFLDSTIYCWRHKENRIACPNQAETDKIRMRFPSETPAAPHHQGVERAGDCSELKEAL